MYSLYDTFNDRIISRHRTIEATAAADRKYQRAIKRANGQNSYIPTTIRDGNGESVPQGIAEAWLDAVNEH